ncbi:MAG: hypothetical protein ACK41E_06130 [Deinococcales bacterium]
MWSLILLCGWALTAPLLSGVPTLPDTSRVEVVGQDLKVKYATGMVSKKVLTLTADKARLPTAARVNVWVAVAGEDVKNFVGVATRDGKDITLELGKERLSFEEILREGYGIRLEWKVP